MCRETISTRTKPSVRPELIIEKEKPAVRRVDEEIESEYLTDPELIHDSWGSRVDLVVDGGLGEDLPSTVVNCAGGEMEVIRYGKGEIDL